ncbi:complement component C1q receptor-like isoform X2 [Sardina pilchardus]|uniref:complement component C1q receptor-like isoform X2 n=1 Tax=Sardina pilchardus TaxID=27697 RepID=UPI002E0F04B3
MTLLLITTLLLSGLGSLSSSVSRQFHVVMEKKNWTEAQQYCREKFTDLATIDDMTENMKVKSKIHEAGAGDWAWIGLKRGDWQWSLADRDFYRENEAEFRNWNPGEPNGEDAGEECVIMEGAHGKWYDDSCSYTRPFICYDGGDSTHPYVLVTDKKNRAGALSYCREKHTDLASVRNQAENDQIEQMRVAGAPGDVVWIGLFRAAWSEWSDGSSSSFRYWNSGEPNNVGVVCTQIMPSGQWSDEHCGHPSPFICYRDTDECARDSSLCGPNAVCTNTKGSFNCACNQGYQKPPGVTITNATNPCQDECAGDSSTCGPNAACSNTQGSFSCACNEGYQKPPGVTITNATNPCQDIDECARDSSLCGPNAACSNTQGSFSCACNQGYQKPPGVTITNATNPCQDTDECARDSSTCGPNAACSNTQGSFSCACNEGYQKPPGVTITNATNPCQDTDECARDSSLCGPNAVCTNTKGSFSCACNEGYEKPPGVTITNATNPCQEPEVKRQIVRVKFPVESGVDMNDPDTLKAVLKQMQKRLGLPADTKLSWKKQPDGKIFKKQKEEKKEEGRKRRKRTEL